MSRVRFREGCFILLFWIFMWYLLATAADTFVVPTPMRTGQVLVELLSNKETYVIIGFSLWRVLVSLLLGVVLGVVLGVFSGMSDWLYKLLSPLVSLITATPVVSFIIILFMYIKNDAYVPVICGVLLCFPIIYNNVINGYKMVSDDLVSMSAVYRVPFARRIMQLYIPSTLPYLFAGLLSSVGICWKATIAAELIGILQNSIGLQLYNGKVFLEYDSVFAWTLLIVICSIVIQRGTQRLMRKLKIYERYKVS